MNPTEFGQFISEERAAKGMTQKELAEKLGVTDKAISKWERGVCLPDVAKFDDIAAALDLTDLEVLRAKRLPPEADTEKTPPFVTWRELGQLALGFFAIVVLRFVYETMEDVFSFHIIAAGRFLEVVLAVFFFVWMGLRHAKGVTRLDQRGFYISLLVSLIAAILLRWWAGSNLFLMAPDRLFRIQPDDFDYLYGGFRWEARYLGYWFTAFSFFDYGPLYSLVLGAPAYAISKALRIRRNRKKQTAG